jgi:hypothetical protein
MLSSPKSLRLTNLPTPHIQLPVPLDPVMWYKPRRALAGPGEVPIPPIAANGFLDYEVRIVSFHRRGEAL